MERAGLKNCERWGGGGAPDARVTMPPVWDCPIRRHHAEDGGGVVYGDDTSSVEEAWAIARVRKRQSAQSAGRHLARQWPTKPGVPFRHKE